MATDNRKRHVVSYENMSREVAEAFAEKYPMGFSDYLPDLVKIPNLTGRIFMPLPSRYRMRYIS